MMAESEPPPTVDRELRRRIREYAAIGTSGSGARLDTDHVPQDELLVRAINHLYAKGDLTSREQMDLQSIKELRRLLLNQAKATDTTIL